MELARMMQLVAGLGVGLGWSHTNHLPCPRLACLVSLHFACLVFSPVPCVRACVRACVRLCRYLGVVLYAPALVLQTATGVPLWASILFTGVIATLWTLKGGMVAVIYTDAVQSVAMIVGVVVCTAFGVSKVPGGFSGVFGAL